MDEQQIIDELSQVMTSSGFRSRKQMCKFLSYIVNEKLEGRGRYLKQYTIAVSGLGKTVDFSPGENPLIRVEAGRLRTLLTKYYDDEGKNNKIRIDLPKGSYQPQFIKTSTNENIEEPVEKLETGQQTGKISKVYSDSIKVLLGFKCFSPTPENLAIYYIIVRDFTLLLNKFPLIKVLSASPKNPSNLAGHDYLNYIRVNYQADFLLKMDVESLDSKLNLKCLLIHTVTEEIVWCNSFNLEEYKGETGFDTIYTQAANDLFAPDNGIAHRYYVQYLQGQDNFQDNEQQLALVYLHKAYIGFTAAELRTALHFCEQRLARHPHDAVTVFVNLHLCLQEYLAGYQITDDLNTRYSTLVTLALRIAADNAETYLFHAFAAYLQGDNDLARSELKRALDLNPHSAFSQFFAGSLYYILGDVKTGDICIAQSVGMNSHHPNWYHIMVSLSAYRIGDSQQALAEAKKVYIPWGNSLRAQLLKQAGMDVAAQRELGNLTSRTQNGLLRPERWLTPDTLTNNRFLRDVLAGFTTLYQTSDPNLIDSPII